jgi:hypothetical protein
MTSKTSDLNLRIPSEAPIEADNAAGPALIAEAETPEYHQQYVFAFLRKEKVLPGRVLAACML